MNDPKLILNQNINIVLAEFEQAIKLGFRFTSKSDLFTSMSGLHELYLFKSDVEITVLGFEDALHMVRVESYDKVRFLLELQTYIVNGYEIDHNSIYYDSYGIKSCKLIRPDHPSALRYSKEELDEMDYEDLKRIGKIRKCFNRQRSVMVSNILKFQEEME